MLRSTNRSRSEKKETRKQGGDLGSIRAQSGLTKAAFRDEIEWELRWAKFLRGVLNDERMEQYFEAHRQQFDGTELRVSHILLRPDGALAARGGRFLDGQGGFDPRRDYRRIDHLRRCREEVLQRSQP